MDPTPVPILGPSGGLQVLGPGIGEYSELVKESNSIARPSWWVSPTLQSSDAASGTRLF